VIRQLQIYTLSMSASNICQQSAIGVDHFKNPGRDLMEIRLSSRNDES